MNKHDQEFLVQTIRTQYTAKEHTAVDELKELDKKVKRPANVLAYTLGAVGAIVMGAGMSLVMTDIGQTVGIASPMVSGILIGIVGMAMAIVNYPLYNNVLAARREKYADQILALSDTILGENDE